MLRPLTALVTLLFLVALCTADDKAPKASAKWLGKSAMPREGVKYMMGGRETTQPLPLPLDVFAEEGEWLYVSGGKVRKADIVLIEQAPAYYDSLLRANPKNTWAMCMRALCYGNDDALEEGFKIVEKAIRLDPKSAEAYLTRGVLYGVEDEYENALKDFDQAIRLRPDYADAYHQRGFYRYEYLDDNEGALADYDAAIKICPEFSEAYVGRGVVYDTLEMLKESLANYDKALSLDPYSIDSLTNRALLRSACSDASLRDGKLAVIDAEKACELTKFKEIDSLVVLAAAYAEAGRFKDAIDTQMKAVLMSSGGKRFLLMKRVGLYRENKPYRYADEFKDDPQ